ncbi:MAG: hypothetical protein FWC27_06670 [Firmicutes bacterium]|nr:hypothetical protein [Bacillota bacterium]
MAILKRILRRALRVLVILLIVLASLVFLLTAVPFAASVGFHPQPLPADATKTLRRAVVGERWMHGWGALLNAFAPAPKDLPDIADYRSEHFYPGGESEGEAWQLGYAQALVTPEDWETKTYYEGGNISIPARKLKSKLDELKVRVIALGTGEGVSVFAAVDTIGVTNRQVRQIRALVADMGLQSVNIAATHVHSAVDTVGFYSKGGKVDEDYIAFANERVAGAIRAAVAAMEPGKLYLSQLGQSNMDVDAFYRKYDEMIGFDGETDEWDDEWDRKWEEQMERVPAEEYGLFGYVHNRRMWQSVPTKLNKLRFVPLDPRSKETLLLNFAAHPFIAGYKHGGWAADSLSGDFIYYMEELINAAGANMMFLNGAVNGINPGYSPPPGENLDENGEPIPYEDRAYVLHDRRVRFIGRDIAAIALAMTMPPEEIAQNTLTDPENEHGYAYGRLVTMMRNSGAAAETELAPRLRIRLSEMRLEMENPVVRFAAKRGMLNFSLLRGEGGKLLGMTEVGCLELGGGAAAVALMPGEITPGLAWGGGDTAARFAIRQRDFEPPTLSQSAGREVLVFGLCNDEVGYVIPDSDYLMFYVPDFLAYRLMGIWAYDHYAELLSPGPGAAGAVAQVFAALLGAESEA